MEKPTIYDKKPAILELEAGSRERVPIAAMTARAMADAREDCFAAGMDAFVTKPVSKLDLAAVIARLDEPAAA